MKTLHVAIIFGIFIVGTISFFVITQLEYDKPSGPNTTIKLESPLLSTKIHSEFFPTNAMMSLNGLSVKGYLSDQNNVPLFDKQIELIINEVTFDNGTTISEKIPVGKTYTDKDGCFYFADWKQDALDQFQKDMLEKAPQYNHSSNQAGINILNSVGSNDITSIGAVFLGDNQFVGSTNSTKIMYHPIIPPIIRPPSPTAFLVNGSDLSIEKGRSYHFILFSSWSETMNLQTLSVEMKNLPCDIHATTDEIAVTGNQTQAVIPIELRSEKTTLSGNFTTYISINNQALEPINLEVK